MKLLLDMNLPPALVAPLMEAGHTAVHRSHIGDPHAADAVVFGWAQANNHVLVTHDLDFGALLAAGGSSSPSVVQLRTWDLRPAFYAPMLLAAVQQASVELAAGALVTVSETQSRIRILPLRRDAT